jgi:hypothetical protein
MRILAATFQTAPQVSGLYTVCDMYPFHLQGKLDPVASCLDER